MSTEATAGVAVAGAAGGVGDTLFIEDDKCENRLGDDCRRLWPGVATGAAEMFEPLLDVGFETDTDGGEV